MIQLEKFINERLKLSNKLPGTRTTLENFITWYLYDQPDWDYNDLKEVQFASDLVKTKFNNSYKKFYDFIDKHRKDIIHVFDEKAHQKYYNYKFVINDKDYGYINFSLLSVTEKDSDLFWKANKYIL